ncbi:ABC transporter ATP-binding protein [Pelolinea submarina]|uniref:Nucleoside ABC transporter ATP-binding protein n=1 Tax=Pelolinea submarina TaxID=913107 RepID=A0A347ZQS0_9CHLR|nr:ABC transporter ATP-binding protein [Pelolinea submarina]REG11793.1 nucleoside ABC transporter ATP-binding protein [Pelolinea submarina]BBB47651.1 simple sugar transport system ATP-binding protein [Pelolinea submarina]
MQHITKIFPRIVANDDISFQLRKGEIHALLGENGAGKSTLMSVLFGLYVPDGGRILVKGKEEKISDPHEANRLGIGMVHQHFKLVQVFTALENIVLGVETTRGGVLQMDEAREKVDALSKQYGLLVDLDKKIEDMTVGMQQRVEILKMLYRESEILVFDEPTAVLTPQEIDELIKIIKELAAEGKSIIFISHKLDEIQQVANRCTILRKGKFIATVNVAEATNEQLSEMMVGRKVMLQVEKDEPRVGEVALHVEDLVIKAPGLSERNKVNHVSFDVRKGEIVSIAGIENNGQHEVVMALTGLMPVNSGKISLNGEDITDWSVRKRNYKHISHIPEDRHKHGLILDFDLANNFILQSYFTEKFCNHGFLNSHSIQNYSTELIKQYDIRSAKGPDTIVKSMSGGNQQKAILAREMDRTHDLLIAVQPTRGLDVGAIEYIHKQLVRERDNGKAILLISLELDEVMNVSDRILVMFNGEIVANVFPKDVSERDLGLYMLGSKVGV